MPIHDWTRVSAGTFHDFHTAWLTHLKEALNAGLLPDSYYAQAEQRAGQTLPDVLTLHSGSGDSDTSETDTDEFDGNGSTAVAVVETPPRVQLTMTMDDVEILRLKQKTLVIRHASDHRVVALVEVISPSNKDREKHVEEFVDKAWSEVKQEIHFVLLDLLPPGPCDPVGMHGRVWYDIGGEKYEPPEGKLLTLASYNACSMPVAYVEPTAVDDELIPMPLFLDPRWYVNLPLRESYETAYRGVSNVWKRVIEERG